MREFFSLFGVKKTEIKSTCIVLPFLPKNILKKIGIDNFVQGKLYGTGSNNLFTSIHTGMGPALLGDAVLYLEETSCRNVILFGSCGLATKTKNLQWGSLVSPSECYSLESFSHMLLRPDRNWPLSFPDKDLFELLTRTNRKIKKVTCLTVGSLKLEPRYLALFKKRGVDIADMECSAFFTAARKTSLRAVAFMYISDIIKQRPFYKISTKEKVHLQSSITESFRILCKFIETL